MAKEIKYLNEKNYSLSTAVWLADDSYDHSPVSSPYVSVTGLLKPIRMIILDQRVRQLQANSDVVEEIDIDRYVASRMGTAIHSAIEHSWTRNIKGHLKAFMLSMKRLGYPKDVIASVRVNPSAEELKTNPKIIPVYMEQRAYRKVGDYTIGGMYDFIGAGNLEDFKSMGVYGYMQADKDEEQLMQGSLYRWLNPELVTSDVMKIQQIFTDWSKLEAMKGIKRGYPQARILEKRLKLKPIKEMQAWVETKIAEIVSHKETPEVELPRCSQKDLWQKNPEYRYYGITGKGELSKRSSCTSEDPTEVYNFMATKGNVGEVREKGAIVKRCGYCSAYELCTMKDEFIQQGILQMP